MDDELFLTVLRIYSFMTLVVYVDFALDITTEYIPLRKEEVSKVKVLLKLPAYTICPSAFMTLRE